MLVGEWEKVGDCVGERLSERESDLQWVSDSVGESEQVIERVRVRVSEWIRLDVWRCECDTERAREYVCELESVSEWVSESEQVWEREWRLSEWVGESAN
jgi:hypothetical protein